jgi:hypothetical protein
MDLVPVTSEDERLYQDFLLNSVQSENQRARLTRLFGEWDYPARKPYFDRLETDSFGNLWVREFTYDARQATTWSILDPHGSWIGDLGLPAGLEVWEIGEDYIFGRMRDANDVEFVVKYALSRGKVGWR